MNSAPFLSSAHGHPSFNPIKIGKNLHLDVTKNSKQPKPPDKPLMPYMRYSKKVWDEVRVRYPDMKIWEISKIVGQMWRELPDEDKQDYIEAFETEKVEYNESLKVYHSSAAYQSWISTLKSKANKDHEDRDNHKRKDKKAGNHGLNSPQKSDGRVSLQLDSEMDDEEDYFSMKHLAAARFYRNHKLVTEVFSDAMVPDQRNVVTNHRLQVLRNQVSSLTMHQKKLDEELKILEDRFQEKKRLLLDSSEKFTSELYKRFASKPIDEASYQKMVDKALEQIRKENSTVLTVKNDIQPTSAAILPNNSLEKVDEKPDSTAVDGNTPNRSNDNSNLKVVTPIQERTFEQSTDSCDSTTDFHNLKENIPLQSQSHE